METGYVTLHRTNTIVASHTWGITNTVPASSTVTANHTLLWANDQDGDFRPIGSAPDIGADEARRVCLPLVLRN